jgi:hypothetical protein
MEDDARRTKKPAVRAIGRLYTTARLRYSGSEGWWLLARDAEGGSQGLQMKSCAVAASLCPMELVRVKLHQDSPHAAH